MKLADIKYPIFPIRSHDKLYKKDGIIYVDTHKNTWIVDNTNLKGNSLAMRRFRITKDLYPLKPAIFTLAQLLRYKSTTHIFIDKFGKLFRYTKTKRCKLEYKKVLSYKYDENTVAFIVEDVNHPIYADFKTLNLYKDMENLFLGLIWYNNSWIFYDISTEKKKKTWKKI